jgi:hypothetical protein
MRIELATSAGGNAETLERGLAAIALKRARHLFANLAERYRALSNREDDAAARLETRRGWPPIRPAIS